MTPAFRRAVDVPLEGLDAPTHLGTWPEEPIHNPWPELADPSDYLRAFSQPIIRTWWLPLSAGRPIGDLPPLFRAAAFHENVHIQLDFTPTNEWARVVLASAYEAVSALIAVREDVDDREVVQLVEKVRGYSRELGEVAETTALAEELLASAWTLRLLRKLDAPPSAAALDSLDTRLNESYRQSLPGFARYFPTVVRYFEVTEAIGPRALARLAIFLNGVRIEGEQVEALEAETRLRLLEDAVATYNDGAKLIRVLDAVPDSREWFAWRTILRLQLSQRESFVAGRHLWRAARGRASRTGSTEEQSWAAAARVQERYWRWHGPGKTASMVMLVPQVHEGHWYVVAAADGAIVRSLGILGLESVRQQLSARIGLRCPFMNYGQCACETGAPVMRSALQKLQRLAMGGALGEGAWTPLPPACTSSA